MARRQRPGTEVAGPPADWVEPTQPCLAGICGETWCAGCPGVDCDRGQRARMVLPVQGVAIVLFAGVHDRIQGAAAAGWVLRADVRCPALASAITGGAIVAPHGEISVGLAEYHAALGGLRALWRTGYRGTVALQGSSQVVVREFHGQRPCESPLLVPLREQLVAAGRHFAGVQVGWVSMTKVHAAAVEARRALAALPAQARAS